MEKEKLKNHENNGNHGNGNRGNGPKPTTGRPGKSHCNIVYVRK